MSLRSSRSTTSCTTAAQRTSLDTCHAAARGLSGCGSARWRWRQSVVRVRHGGGGSARPCGGKRRTQSPVRTLALRPPAWLGRSDPGAGAVHHKRQARRTSSAHRPHDVPSYHWHHRTRQHTPRGPPSTRPCVRWEEDCRCRSKSEPARCRPRRRPPPNRATEALPFCEPTAAAGRCKGGVGGRGRVRYAEVQYVGVETRC